MPGEPLVNNYKIPTWAGKPPTGLHLDVMKEGKLVQKLMIDEKSCYFFGRNRQLCDFSVDHQSCSRVHAALVWHKHLNRAFIIDLGSVHGTFIGKIRLEADRPQQVPIDSEIHFGASTRLYIIRERPAPLYSLNTTDPERVSASVGGTALAGSAGANGEADPKLGDALSRLHRQLPRDEVELDNLTQFNTAHNRRITSIAELPPTKPLRTQRRMHSVHFNDIEEVINPEDVDPSVGRFRNLVQETFIPNKGKDAHEGADLGVSAPKRNAYIASAYENSTNGATGAGRQLSGALSASNPNFSLAAKLGLPLPNLAPNLEETDSQLQRTPAFFMFSRRARNSTSDSDAMTADDIRNNNESGDGVAVKRPHGADGKPEAATAAAASEPKKKKYAKEAWPGKRPTFLVGPVP
nr:unnamed protein product [Spirometra erinaceieuropaei]